MNTANADYFLDHLDESLDTYLTKTRHAFSGENGEIQFFLQDDLDGQFMFIWKQQNILTRGKIMVYPLSNILTISDTLKQMLEQYQRCQERILTLEKENECLNTTNVKLIADIEDMINIKNAMERDLYRKFLILLNTKKQKIRELQEALHNKKQTIDKSVYDETTDESEGSEKDSKKMQDTDTKKRKRKADCKNERQVIPKISKKYFERCTTFSSSESLSPEPSTSKGKLMLQDTEAEHMTKSKTHLNTSDEEPEEDLF